MSQLLDVKSLKDQVYARLKAEILRGAFRPGMPIRDRELCVRFGISRTPIREALLQLGGEGLVVFSPRRGIFVSCRTIDEIEEIYMLLGVLEAFAARRAIRRMGRAEIDRMAELTRELERAYKRNDIASFIRINAKIHEVFLRTCGSQRLTEICMKLRDQLHQYPLRMLSLPGWMKKSLEEHREIFRAFQERRERQIERIIRRHWRFKETRREILERLTQVERDSDGTAMVYARG